MEGSVGLGTMRYLLWLALLLALLLAAGSEVQSAPLSQEDDATLRIVNDGWATTTPFHLARPTHST